MRKLLMIVIFLNTLDVIGNLISVMTTGPSDMGFFTKLGSAFDAVLWPLSIVIIGIAVLFLYKIDLKPNT